MSGTARRRVNSPPRSDPRTSSRARRTRPSRACGPQACGSSRGGAAVVRVAASWRLGLRLGGRRAGARRGSLRLGGRGAGGPGGRGRRRLRRRRGLALARRDLVAHDLLGQLRDQLLQEAGHPLLLAAELPGELRGVAVIQAVGELLDREVVRDLLELVEQLGLRVLQQLLGLTRAADRVQRALRERDALLRGGGHLRRRLRGDLRTGKAHGLGLATELLDAPLQRPSPAPRSP